MQTASDHLVDAVCPECDHSFQIEGPEKGEVITCSDCSLNLLVLDVDPAKKTVILQLTETNVDDWGE